MAARSPGKFHYSPASLADPATFSLSPRWDSSLPCLGADLPLEQENPLPYLKVRKLVVSAIRAVRIPFLVPVSYFLPRCLHLDCCGLGEPSPRPPRTLFGAHGSCAAHAPREATPAPPFLQRAPRRLTRAVPKSRSRAPGRPPWPQKDRTLGAARLPPLPPSPRLLVPASLSKNVPPPNTSRRHTPLLTLINRRRPLRHP